MTQIKIQSAAEFVANSAEIRQEIGYLGDADKRLASYTAAIAAGEAGEVSKRVAVAAIVAARWIWPRRYGCLLPVSYFSPDFTAAKAAAKEAKDEGMLRLLVIAERATGRKKEAA